MGNQLVGVAPSQIYPVEHYLSDHVDLTFDQSLGSTRFLKVARARSREGLVVVKVFAVHDPSLPLAEHKERILKIKEQLASAFNCLPFQRVILTDKAGLLMREYCKYSVYDRMSTRPFLTVLEKKWITFQVLYALHRMHKLSICHGDIKLENIMVTSWLWVLLTDIASFKPTFVPDDNPADFGYFFDTSRRRLCYVAPERFVRAPDPANRPVSDDRSGGLLLSESPCKVGELVPSMDIFSAGCALLELWNDGTPALDLPGLLAYRNGEDRPSTMTLPEGSDPRLKSLLHSMTERNPKDRKSAELYLDEARGK
ncbi:protein kinase domain-containing protein [Phthorimaea operculella]|nr:protein kinase domain-containing protein [Phthorimaea operculella]